MLCGERRLDLDSTGDTRNELKWLLNQTSKNFPPIEMRCQLCGWEGLEYPQLGDKILCPPCHEKAEKVLALFEVKV